MSLYEWNNWTRFYGSFVAACHVHCVRCVVPLLYSRASLVCSFLLYNLFNIFNICIIYTICYNVKWYILLIAYIQYSICIYIPSELGWRYIHVCIHWCTSKIIIFFYRHVPTCTLCMSCIKYNNNNKYYLKYINIYNYYYYFING